MAYWLRIVTDSMQSQTEQAVPSPTQAAGSASASTPATLVPPTPGLDLETPASVSTPGDVEQTSSDCKHVSESTRATGDEHDGGCLGRIKASVSVACAWQEGKSTARAVARVRQATATAWQIHGSRMAKTRPGDGMAMAWRWHGNGMARAWHGHGMPMEWQWQWQWHMAWQWHGNGMAMAMVMACQWHGKGMAMARQWQWQGHGHGMAMSWRRHGNGIPMAWQWHGNGMAMAWPWHGNGSVSGMAVA